MKQLPLTKGKFAIVDDEDFDIVNKWKWYYQTDREKESRSGGCAARYRNIRMHRFLLNVSENEIVDHKNGNGLDNRRSNLRVCTKSQNAMNSKGKKGTVSGIKGVSWNRGKWVAFIQVNGKLNIIDRFLTKEAAAWAYKIVSLIEFGEFAYSTRSVDKGIFE